MKIFCFIRSAPQRQARTKRGERDHDECRRREKVSLRCDNFVCKVRTGVLRAKIIASSDLQGPRECRCALLPLRLGRRKMPVTKQKKCVRNAAIFPISPSERNSGSTAGIVLLFPLVRDRLHFAQECH